MSELSNWENYFGAEWELRQHAERFPSSVRDFTGPSGGVATAPQAVARVSAGRWVASCPLPNCCGCELISLRRATFFCCECRNKAWNHQPLPVVLPGAAMVTGIETALLKRPAPATRNWLPGETVADLNNENAEHGIS